VVSAEGGVHGFPVVLTSFIGRDAVMGEVAGLLEDCRLVTGPDGLAALSRRERELVALVARGRTDAQIAAELYISVSTVRTHLDRIRDKTGCRRRADLTRLALQAELA
jgi:DNA-binding CsgD family transcriptional regulator